MAGASTQVRRGLWLARRKMVARGERSSRWSVSPLLFTYRPISGVGGSIPVVFTLGAELFPGRIRGVMMSLIARCGRGRLPTSSPISLHKQFALMLSAVRASFFICRPCSTGVHTPASLEYRLSQESVQPVPPRCGFFTICDIATLQLSICVSRASRRHL